MKKNLLKIFIREFNVIIGHLIITIGKIFSILNLDINNKSLIWMKYCMKETYLQERKCVRISIVLSTTMSHKQIL